MNKKLEYTAIKPMHLPYYIWFKTANITDDGINFKGIDGWGKDGALISIEIKTYNIESYIYSDTPQYR